MKVQGAYQHQFSQVPTADIPRSVFNRSHGHKTTFNEGQLIPVYLDEVVPGDSFSVSATCFARVATLIKPIMDNITMSMHFFFVPARLVWTNWVKLMGERTDPVDDYDNDTEYAVPTVTTPTSTGFTVGSLYDYLGIPIGVPDVEISNLPARCYNKIYADWYRDQNLIDSPALDMGDSGDDVADYVIRRRAKRHDYFTSCLPWPQKGPAVELPLGENAPVVGIGKLNQVYTAGSQAVYETGGSATKTYTSYKSIESATDNWFGVSEDPNNTGYPGIFADLANATAATINSFRQAFQIQRLYERDARSGTRYVESIKAHYGVVSPDFRLQRSEYLGGADTGANVSAVPQTSATGLTGGSTKQANLSGYGTIVLNGAGFTKSFTEHGYVLGIVSCRADNNYQQGINKLFLRSTRFDFYYPALANLGEQAVTSIELFAQGPTVDTGSTGTPDNEKVFGYQERWAEMRYKPNQVSGIFRSTYSTPLDSWHLAQEFTGLPTLSQTFIEQEAPMDRVIAVTSEPHFLFDSHFSVRVARPMPVYSVPGLIDHL